MVRSFSCVWMSHVGVELSIVDNKITGYLREGVNIEYGYLQADDLIFQIPINVSVHMIYDRLVYIVAPFCNAYISV